MNKRQLIAAYNKGLLDEVKDQCVRYGTIEKVTDFDITEGYHAGAHRIYKINHHKTEWNIEMHNGEVKLVGYKTN